MGESTNILPSYQAMLEAVPSLYLMLDRDLAIVGVTDAFLQSTMTERESIIGCGIFEVFPDNPDDPDATGERNLRASLERVLELGVSDAMSVQKYDIRRPDDEGGAFEVRYWSPSNHPVVDDDGNVTLLIHRVEDVTELIRLQEAGTQMELEMQARTERLREVTEPARQAANEYRRALRDYTQLMRHRLANPLTAITGGISTLRDLDLGLDKATRFEILDSMAAVAAQLENAVLHPQSLDGVEQSLNAIPNLQGHLVDDRVEVDAVKAEEAFRDINLKMVAQLGDPGQSRRLEFFCECWSPHCTTMLTMVLRDYFSIHRRTDQFIISPGHEMPSVEHVTERNDGWWVVRKFPSVQALAQQDEC